ncbi:hypothetical protein [Sphingomonas radiodurans]|uniref:hypothetical protein n=1 Tax=Sphingomonas radiodurans TaxID=2890321 RepID=UPI001E3638B1|nr:hypothetical protein [Sphingomonas radiodurans]WBH17302.1 hypothetical protein LLW23_04110 [Sphingomonas radiodurans]
MHHFLGGARCALLPLVLPLILITGACSSEQPESGAISADQERQLNEAAIMLDANSVSLDTIDDNGATP